VIFLLWIEEFNSFMLYSRTKLMILLRYMYLTFFKKIVVFLYPYPYLGFGKKNRTKLMNWIKIQKNEPLLQFWNWTETICFGSKQFSNQNSISFGFVYTFFNRTNNNHLGRFRAVRFTFKHFNLVRNTTIFGSLILNLAFTSYMFTATVT